MISSQRRNRALVFRVTEQEYHSLRSACDAVGGRSLSDYIRSELLPVEPAGAHKDSLLGRLPDIDRKLTELSRAMKHLLARIENGAVFRNP